MRVLPFPWEGLHPAFPNKTEPFNTSAVANAATFSGTLGSILAVGAAMIRRSPQIGIKVAAYTTPTLAVTYYGLADYAGRKVSIPYLESKGIQVPKRKLIDRPFRIDADNFCLGGAFGALVLARFLNVQWTVTGWKRVVGIMSIGAFAGDMSNYAYNWKQIVPAAEQIKQRKAQKLMWASDIATFVNQQQHQDIRAHHAEISANSQSGMMPLQDLLKRVQGGDLADLATTTMQNHITGEQLDQQDPQPHNSEYRDGERIFKPETNYKWEAGPDGIQKLESHIAALSERRAHLAKEAAMLFHEIALKEAKYYDTPISSPTKDQQRITLEVMNHLHINAYLEISQLDWCIADSQKNILQISAMSKSTHWIPEKPAPVTNTPKHTLALLNELDHDNQMLLSEQEMLFESGKAAMQDPALEAIDPKTGHLVQDPHKEIKREMRELERAREESRMMQKAIEELRGGFTALEHGEEAKIIKDEDKEKEKEKEDEKE